MPIKLEIKRTDGSIYWTENFDLGSTLEDEAAAGRWLAIEQSRDYWDPSLVSTFTPYGPTPEQIEQRRLERESHEAKQAERKTRRQLEIKPLVEKVKAGTNLSAPEEKTLLRLIVLDLFSEE